jgi:glycosyltransferase involved in cell wall biosynthesis/MoaA/NifB/PqqE/SkfB family radical SAM enzyme
MHILKIIHGYPPHYNAGSEVYSQSIVNELSKKNRISVFTREENPYAPDFQIRHHQEHELLDFYFVNNPQAKDGYRHKQLDDQFALLIDQLQPDVAHVGHLNHLSTGIIDILYQRQIPIVFTLHDFWLMCPRGQFLTRSIGQADNFQLCEKQEHRKCASDCYRVYFSGKEENEAADMQRWSSWVEERMQETQAIVSKINLFIAPSNYLRNRFIRDFGIPESKIKYLDYGFPTEYLTPSHKFDAAPIFTFGYIGTLIPAKGVQMLIQAFKKINAPARLLIFGRFNGQSSDALKLLAATSINPIEFAGEYVNQNLANDVFSKVDCIVVPSIWTENSPLVIHEAQACKIPVITANTGGMSEYVKHQVNGLLFEHRNLDALQEQMEFALKNRELIKQLGQRGYLYTTNGSVPSIQDHCSTLEQVYKDVQVNKLWRITIDTNPEDCNLKCIMCEEHSPYSDFIPRLFKATGVKRRRMAMGTVEDIFQQSLKLGVKEIIPSTMGEPLLFKGIEQLFELSQKTGIKINLTTNGTFPKQSVKEWAKLIVPNTTDVKISWNGSTAETSEKVMLGVKFDQVLQNVKDFIAYRDEYFNDSGYFCRVTFQLTFMQNNMHELAEIVKLAASLGVDRVKGHHLWAHFSEIKALSMKHDINGIENWNQYVEQAYLVQEKFRKPNGEKVILENIYPINHNAPEEIPEHFNCPFLEKELWISATGKISPCCAPDELRASLGDFGNIQTSSIQEVLKSSLYLDLVNNYKSKSLCKTCNMRKPIQI